MESIASHGRHWLDASGGERVHVTEQNARDSLEFLRTRPRDKAFLLTVGYFAPHAEDSAKEQYLPQDWSAASYDGAKVPPSPLGGEKHLRALPPFLASETNEGRVRFRWRFDTPERYQECMIRYYRLITEVDAAMGRLVDELKAQDVYENTLIAVIGDNGYFHGDRGLADKWRLAEHRSNPTCAACHNLMDPVGLSLERFDAVGRRRLVEDRTPIDASGGLPDGGSFADVDGLEAALLRRPELFVGAFAEKLLTYASGRGVEYYDAPAIRAIVRKAHTQDFRLSSIVLGVVNSKLFQMRKSR